MYHYTKLPALFSEGAVFTAFDTETTGLYPAEHRIIELGAVRFDKDGIIATYSTFVNPLTPIPESASRINGITDIMVRSSPEFQEVIPGFLEFIKGTKLIAHNAGFDTAFMNCEMTRCGMTELKPPAVPAIDTLRMTRKVFPQLGKYSLQFLAEKFMIDVRNAHRAEDDARVCMEVFLKALSCVPVNRAELLPGQPECCF